MTSNQDEGLRHIELDGAFNVRDVGGYTTEDGSVTRWRRLLRADSLHRLTAESQRRLLDYGLGTVIDLRRPTEVAREANVFATSGEVQYHNLPLLLDEHREHEEATTSPLELYRFFLDNCREQLREIMTTIAESTPPVLVHCFVGKDRTGVVIALALGAAGVASETIADDYELSEQPLLPLMAEIRARLVGLGIDVTRFDLLSGAPRAAMIETLAYVEKQYGDAAGYLTAIGLGREHIEALRRLLVE